MAKAVDSSKVLALIEGLDLAEKRKVFQHLKADLKAGAGSRTKISDTYGAITSKPQDMDALLKKYGLSPNVMRHHKRFDPYQERGRVRTGTVAGVRLVWREPPQSGGRPSATTKQAK